MTVKRREDSDTTDLTRALAEFADQLRRAGRPVATTETLDGAYGLVALAAAMSAIDVTGATDATGGTGLDDELVAAVLAATMVKSLHASALRPLPHERIPPLSAHAAFEASIAAATVEAPPAKSQRSPFDHGDDEHPRDTRRSSEAATSAADGTATIDTRNDQQRSALTSEGSSTEAGEQYAVDGAQTGPKQPHAVQPATRQPFAPQWRPRLRNALVEPEGTDDAHAAARAWLRRLDGAPSPPRRARTGELDLARTVEQALRPGGSLLPLHRRARGRTRAKVLVLVDVSNSVRGVATGWLGVAAAMARCSRHVRVIAISDQAVEVTGVLRKPHRVCDLTAMVAATGADPTALSDWGAAFAAIVRTQTGARMRRSHLLVMGDGRSNGHSPNTQDFAAVVGWCASSQWITSEPQGAWTLGNGEPAAYRRLVTSMVTARTTSEVFRLAHAPRVHRL